MMTKPEQEHAWLGQLVGEWAVQSTCESGPGQPPMTWQGQETVRTLGELWIVCEGIAQTPDGGTMASMTTLGFDPGKKKFVGTWVGSPMATMFVYEGTLDASGKVLPLHCEGPNCMEPGSLARYQDIIGIESPDRRTLTSHMQGKDGVWVPFMKAVYTRVT